MELKSIPVETGIKAGAAASPGLIIFCLALGGFAIGTTEFSAMAMVPYFAADLGISQAQAAGAISAYAAGVVAGAPLVAVAGSRFSQKALLIGLMAAFAVFNTLSALAPSFQSFVVLRFLSGLPHGAYFGVAALMAAAQVHPSRKATAMSRMSLGLTIATIVGVPGANLFGQTIGWRWGFALVGILAVITALAVWRYAPSVKGETPPSLKTELKALRNRQVLLTLATGAIGFGGFFSVYTYIASTMTFEMRTDGALVPMALSVVGIGMTISAFISGWAADRSRTWAGFGFMAAAALVMLLYPMATANKWTYMLVLLALGITAGLPTVLQSRLIDVAGESQKLAAALNQSAFNIANALGPWAAATVIGLGGPFSSSGYVGVAFTLGGIVLYAITIYDARRRRS